MGTCSGNDTKIDEGIKWK